MTYDPTIYTEEDVKKELARALGVPHLMGLDIKTISTSTGRGTSWSVRMLIGGGRALEFQGNASVSAYRLAVQCLRGLEAGALKITRSAPQ